MLKKLLDQESINEKIKLNAQLQTAFIKLAIVKELDELSLHLQRLTTYDTEDCLICAESQGKSVIADQLKRKLLSKCKFRSCKCEQFVFGESESKCSQCSHSSLWHKPPKKPIAELLV